MFRAFVMSDVHGDAACLETALAAYEREKKEAGTMDGALPILMMGDLLYHGPRNPVPEHYDPKKCAAMYNEYAQEMIVIRGNCDAEVDQMMLKIPVLSPFMIFPIEGRRMVLTHGHHPFSDYFLEKGNVVLYGHTHVLRAEEEEGIIYLNPGSVSLPKEGNPRTYAMLEGRTFTVKTMDGACVKSLAF